MGTAENIKQLQRDSQQTGSPEEAIGAQINAALKDLHTSMPGIIISFDPSTQSAVVQPSIQRIFTEKGPVNLPPCMDVPVQFPGGGNFVLTFPVSAGDECILLFSERAIDYWYVNGGVQLPAEYRLHDYSDGMAIVGLRSNPRKLTGFQMSGMEMRTIDRGTYIRLEAGNIYIKGNIIHQGDNTQTGNMTRNGTSNLNGNTSVTGTMQNNGTNIGSTHKHHENDVHGLTDGPQ